MCALSGMVAELLTLLKLLFFLGFFVERIYSSWIQHKLIMFMLWLHCTMNVLPTLVVHFSKIASRKWGNKDQDNREYLRGYLTIFHYAMILSKIAPLKLTPTPREKLQIVVRIMGPFKRNPADHTEDPTQEWKPPKTQKSSPKCEISLHKFA